MKLLPSALRVATLVFVASFATAMGAQAQGVVKGITESTDPAKAAAVERQVQELKAQPAKAAADKTSAFIVRGKTDAGYGFLSGGISIKDRTTMHAERKGYSLWVATVAKPSGAYLSDAKLRIVNLDGKKTVVERTMDGPWFFVALPAGRYQITATVPPDGPDAAQTLTTDVKVARSGKRQAVLRFASSAKVGPEMVSPFGGNPFGKPSTSK